MQILSLDFEAVRREVEEQRAAGSFRRRISSKGNGCGASSRWRSSASGRACAADGKELRFALFSAYDLEGDAAVERPRYEDLARRFETTAVDVTNQLAAARRDFRRVVLDLLRELTVSDAEFRAEARALLGVEPPA